MAQKLEHCEQRMVLEELLDGMRQESDRVERLEQAIRDAVPEWWLAEVATACRPCAASISLPPWAVVAETAPDEQTENAVSNPPIRACSPTSSGPVVSSARSIA